MKAAACCLVIRRYRGTPLGFLPILRRLRSGSFAFDISELDAFGHKQAFLYINLADDLDGTVAEIASKFDGYRRVSNGHWLTRLFALGQLVNEPRRWLVEFISNLEGPPVPRPRRPLTDWASLCPEHLSKEHNAFGLFEPKRAMKGVTILVFRRRIGCQLAAAGTDCPRGHDRYEFCTNAPAAELRNYVNTFKEGNRGRVRTVDILRS